jgi:hypothetical protein
VTRVVFFSGPHVEDGHLAFANAGDQSLEIHGLQRS